MKFSISEKGGPVIDGVVLTAYSSNIYSSESLPFSVVISRYLDRVDLKFQAKLDLEEGSNVYKPRTKFISLEIDKHSLEQMNNVALYQIGRMFIKGSSTIEVSMTLDADISQEIAEGHFSFGNSFSFINDIAPFIEFVPNKYLDLKVVTPNDCFSIRPFLQQARDAISQARINPFLISLGSDKIKQLIEENIKGLFCSSPILEISFEKSFSLNVDR